MAQPPILLILSQGYGEYTTCLVMEHLFQMGVPLARLNGSDFDSRGNFSMSIEAGQVKVENERLDLDLSYVQAVWFRRWQERQPFQGINLFNEILPECFTVSQRVDSQLSQELRRVSSLLFAELDNAAWVSHPRTSSLNKLEVLKLASRVGLETPATLVTTNKARLLQFASRGPVITKPIGQAMRFLLGNGLHLMYTQELSEETLRSLPNQFFPSLFQEKIEKQYELRVFFLDGTCHSSAIFSQLDERTKSDFRSYNDERPNRIVPYRLPIEIEKSIGSLMDELGLETGSLDLIKTPGGRIVFLEVNPVGQFGMISSPCNYHLERKVAELLARKVGHARS